MEYRMKASVITLIRLMALIRAVSIPRLREFVRRAYESRVLIYDRPGLDVHTMIGRDSLMNFPKTLNAKSHKHNWHQALFYMHGMAGLVSIFVS